MKSVKNDGGLVVRLVEALNGFRTKHGYWPLKVELGGESIVGLVTHHLTPFGLFLLQSKVEIVLGKDGALIARGRRGHKFDYGVEGWRGEHEHDARAWLGFLD